MKEIPPNVEHLNDSSSPDRYRSEDVDRQPATSETLQQPGAINLPGASPVHRPDTQEKNGESSTQRSTAVRQNNERSVDIGEKPLRNEHDVPLDAVETNKPQTSDASIILHPPQTSNASIILHPPQEGASKKFNQENLQQKSSDKDFIKTHSAVSIILSIMSVWFSGTCRGFVTWGQC